MDFVPTEREVQVTSSLRSNCPAHGQLHVRNVIVREFIRTRQAQNETELRILGVNSVILPRFDDMSRQDGNCYGFKAPFPATESVGQYQS